MKEGASFKGTGQHAQSAHLHMSPVSEEPLSSVQLVHARARTLDGCAGYSCMLEIGFHCVRIAIRDLSFTRSLVLEYQGYQ